MTHLTSKITALSVAGILWFVCVPAPALSAEGQEDLPHAFEAGWKGEKTCEVIFQDDSLRVGRCVFPPGVGHEKHYHNPHFGYVLETGTIRIRDSEGEREVTPRAGTHWSSPAVTVHEALNVGETTSSYLIVEPVMK